MDTTHKEHLSKYIGYLVLRTESTSFMVAVLFSDRGGSDSCDSAPSCGIEWDNRDLLAGGGGRGERR